MLDFFESPKQVPQPALSCLWCWWLSATGYVLLDSVLLNFQILVLLRFGSTRQAQFWNMDNLERDWMYKRLDDRGGINSSFITGVNKFLQFLRSLAHGPLISAKCYPVYFVNGYKFHTECHGSEKINN
ncbi:uncharacterized protein [Nicotiana sylvestris]|uniref:uncharacterized protein n=1 Tax=Nicotiana sylvestris TaxID=4096 RepID=UPI00388C4C05